MNEHPGRWLAFAALLILYLLHNDLWLWDDPSLLFGLPVGLTYHVGVNVAAAVVMFLLVKFAWPSELEVVESDEVSGPGHADEAVPAAFKSTAGEEERS